MRKGLCLLLSVLLLGSIFSGCAEETPKKMREAFASNNLPTGDKTTNLLSGDWWF